MQTLRRAGTVATALLCLAIVAAAVVAGRIVIFEYFHGGAAMVHHLLDWMVG